MDEEQLKQEIRVQEEEERPSKAETPPDLKLLLQQEIRNAIKEMLVEGQPLVDAPVKREPKPEQERRHFTNPFRRENHSASSQVSVLKPPEEIFQPTEPPPIESDGSSPGAAKPPGNPSDFNDPDKEPNEWAKYEKHQFQMSEYLENEWDHKSWMLSTKFFDKEVIQLHELVLKELSLSNLPDAELAFIYSIKMDCIEEWLSMGFTDLAKQRLVHMLFRLRLLTSIDAVELVGQHGTSTMSMTMDRENAQREAMDQEDQQNKPKLGLSAIRKRLGGLTK